MAGIISHMELDDTLLNKEYSIELDTGKVVNYSIKYNNDLVINMTYVGDGAYNKNKCGWKRDSRYYFKELFRKHPEYFSEENTWKIQDGYSPICDHQFIKYFPEYKDFLNEKLIHHHIGEDGQAVALPESLHRGYGVVHNDEKEIGVTDNGYLFSEEVKIINSNGQNFDWEDAANIMKTAIKQKNSLSGRENRLTVNNDTYKQSDNTSNKTEITSKIINTEEDFKCEKTIIEEESTVHEKNNNYKKIGNKSIFEKSKEVFKFTVEYIKNNPEKVFEATGKAFKATGRVFETIAELNTGKKSNTKPASILKPDNKHKPICNKDSSNEIIEKNDFDNVSIEKKSPSVHMKKAHVQHYNTKEGRILVKKESYRSKKDHGDND